MTRHYLRNLIKKRQDILLQTIPSDGDGTITLEQLFSRLGRQSQNINTQLNLIESLVNIHRQVSKTASSESIELQNLTQQLFTSLGVNFSDVSTPVVQDYLENLNALYRQALFFLGEKIATKYLLETQPNDPLFYQFKPTPKVGITYNGRLNETLDPQQVIDFQSWLDDFSSQCGNIFTAFIEPGLRNEALFDDI